MESFRRRSCLVFLSICPFCIASAVADTISTWNGSTGNWSNSANWSPATVPNNTSSQSYGVVVNSGQPNLDINATVNTLTFGPGGSVYLGGDSAYPFPVYDLTLTVNHGDMNLNNFTGGAPPGFGPGADAGIGDSLTLGGNATSSGFRWSGALSIGGNFTNSGTGVVLGSITPPGPGSLSVGGTMTNSGTLTFGDLSIHEYAVGGGGFGSLINTGTIQISPNSSVGVGGSGVTRILAGSSWLVEGTFTGFQNLANIDGTLNLENPTTMTPRAGTLTISNSGTFGIGTSPALSGPSTITINGNLSNSGNLTLGIQPIPGIPGEGGTLNVSGTLTNQANGTLSLNNMPPGPFDIPPFPSQLNAQKLVNYGTVNFENGTTVVQTLQNYGVFNLVGSDGSTPALTTVTAKTFLSGGSQIGIGPDGALVVGSGTATPQSGAFDELANGTLDFAGTTIAAQNASLNGTLDIMLGDGSKPIGTVFNILLYTPFAGTFSNVEGLVFDGGHERYALGYDTIDGIVSLTVEKNTTPEPCSIFLLLLGLAGVGGAGRVKISNDPKPASAS